MESHIKGKSIVLLENMPKNITKGDRVDISINPLPEVDYSFPTFELGIKDEYLNREKIVESNH